jgi:glucosylceramidase
MEEEVLRAYALYFLKFVRAYHEEGIEVSRLHLQNEPFADQKFPSCLWSADQFIVFIRDYIGPLFESEKEAAEIWLGTLNGPGQMSFGPGGIRLDSYDDYVDRILLDGGARRHIRGVGYQWAGRADIQRTHESWPELGIMQTENECGDGGNGWDYAFYVFNLMRHYFANGACSYAYWNMVLEPGGLSTWGWPQNSMITIDPEKGDAILNPEYYVMKHYSRFVKGGARRRATTGRWSGSSTAFENPDGTLVLVTGNLQPSARTMAVAEGGKRVASLCLAPRSINTIVFAY